MVIQSLIIFIVILFVIVLLFALLVNFINKEKRIKKDRVDEHKTFTITYEKELLVSSLFLFYIFLVIPSLFTFVQNVNDFYSILILVFSIAPVLLMFLIIVRHGVFKNIRRPGKL